MLVGRSLVSLGLVWSFTPGFGVGAALLLLHPSKTVRRHRRLLAKVKVNRTRRIKHRGTAASKCECFFGSSLAPDFNRPNYPGMCTHTPPFLVSRGEFSLFAHFQPACCSALKRD